MLFRTSAATLTVFALAVVGVACGGGSSSSKTSETTVPDTTAPDTTPTTTSASDDTEPAASDVDPCELLTSEELEAKASVAKVTSFAVDSQEPSGPDGRGAVSCKTVFKVTNEEPGGSTTIDATVNVEVLSRDAASRYDLLRQTTSDASDVDGLGDQAFWSEENSYMRVLVGNRLVTVDVNMPGVFEDTNRPVADAISPIIVGRL